MLNKIILLLSLLKIFVQFNIFVETVMQFSEYFAE